MQKIYFFVFFLFFLLISQNSYSQILFTASLNGAGENPDVTTDATATAWAVLSPDMTSLTYRVTYARLSSAFTAGHFHKAHPDSSGGVVQAITFTGNTASGTWSNISAENLAALLKGYIYINIHTTNNGGGEIRGHLNAVQGIGFTAALTGEGENPDVTTNASGTAWAVITNKGTQIQYAMTIAGLSGNPTGSHFHNAPADSNGGVVHGFTLSDSTINSTWADLPDNMITQALQNRLYLNVHTAGNPGGEIRGQLLHQGEAMFTISLDGAGENPDVTTDAKGTGWAVLTSTLNSLAYNVTYARLSSAFSAAHFHNAPSDSNGGVVQAITFSGNNSSGTWTNMTDTQVQQLIKERLYVNIHSANNPSGEIRGQVVLAPVGFTAVMDGAQEGGSVTTSAVGTGWFSYMPNMLDYQFTFAGLSGTYSNAHFHNAATGLPGGVVQPITVADSTTTSYWSNIADSYLSELAYGKLYVNIHSTAYPSGEIRGQVLFSNYVSGNVPVELTSFAAYAAGSSVELNWTTATETNNAGFEIERSSSPESGWMKIGFAAGRGTSSETVAYRFIDKNSGAGKNYYRLKQVDFDGSFTYSNVVEINLNVPLSFKLNQNYPNPFNPSTTISFAVPEKSDVTLKIYNVLGKEVASLINEVREAGNYNINFDASQLASGIYFYKLSAGNNISTKKMTLIK